MFARNLNFKPRRNSNGVSLIEVLISVLVMGVGLLGIAAMQATALRNSQSALARSPAVIQSYTILDAMRATVVESRISGYDTAMCAAPAGTPLATADRVSWLNAVRDSMGATACGAIACDATTCTVTVQWDDTRGSNGIAAQQFATVTRL